MFSHAATVRKCACVYMWSLIIAKMKYLNVDLALTYLSVLSSELSSLADSMQVCRKT